MGTNNFLIKNTSERFSFTPEEDYEEGVSDTIENIQSELVSLDWDEMDESENNWFYGGSGTNFARKCVEIPIEGKAIFVTLIAVYRYGYYEGVCFDFNIEIELYHTYRNETPDSAEVQKNLIDMGLEKWVARLRTQRVLNKIGKAITTLKTELENIYKKYTD